MVPLSEFHHAHFAIITVRFSQEEEEELMWNVTEEEAVVLVVAIVLGQRQRSLELGSTE